MRCTSSNLRLLVLKKICSVYVSQLLFVQFVYDVLSPGGIMNPGSWIIMCLLAPTASQREKSSGRLVSIATLKRNQIMLRKHDDESAFQY